MTNEMRAATTGELENALEGLQSIAEAIEAALAQVGYAEPDEPGDGEDVSAGPFTDEEYQGALETIASLLEGAEGLLDGVDIADPDEAEDVPTRAAPARPVKRRRLREDQRRELDAFEQRCGRFGDRERRVLPITVAEVRDSGNPDVAFAVVGHAAVFGRKSLNLGGFQEVIDPSAFNKVLDSNPDVHLLWDHDTRLVLARTRSKTFQLELREDPKGLRYYARVAPTSYSADLRVAMEGGLIDQASFAFTVGSDTWEIRNEGKPTEIVVRTIHEVDELFDVTITAQGAYPQTDSSVVRSYALDYAYGTGRLEERGPIPDDVAQDEPADEDVAPVTVDAEGESDAPDAPDVESDSADGDQDEQTPSLPVRKARARMGAAIARHRADLM